MTDQARRYEHVLESKLLVFSRCNDMRASGTVGYLINQQK